MNRYNKLFISNLKVNLNEPIQDRINKERESIDIWYQLIHIDANEVSCQNDIMFSDIIEKSTYLRWTERGTFYGFSRFSSVILTNFKKNDDPFIYYHHKTMYYQFAVLLLFYRGALLSFSRKSAEIAKLFQFFDKNRKDGLKKLKALYKEFILFKNTYWFKEVSAQDQGIEIFNLWNEKLNNPALMDDVKSEIHELYEFVNYETDQDENKSLSTITIIGAIALPISLVFSFWGMDILPDSFQISCLISMKMLTYVFTPGVVVGLLFFGLFKFIKSRNKS